jgi:hypothetical protein
MVAAGAVGTTVDMLYGYFVECAEFRKPSVNNDVDGRNKNATSTDS